MNWYAYDTTAEAAPSLGGATVLPLFDDEFPLLVEDELQPELTSPPLLGALLTASSAFLVSIKSLAFSIA